MEKSKIDRRARTARAIAKGGKEIVMALTDAALGIVERNWMNHPTRLWTYVARANFTSKDGKVMINGANVLKTDIVCGNGVIHVIDAVILPPE